MRALGNTGIVVSQIGLGAGPLGALPEREAIALIHAAIDRGITLIDTAPSYGRSEEYVGAACVGKAVVISTKLGYGTPGIPDWTGPCITAGIEAALRRLGRIDIAHLHSCPLDVLERGDVIDALEAARRAGKIRVAAYSGDNAPLEWAIASGRFGVVQCSLSALDQRALRVIPYAVERGIGVLAKRPLANGVWRDRERPSAPDRAIYWDRLQAMHIELDAPRALGFVLAQPISSALVGTTNIEHLAITPIEADYRAAFDDAWDGVI